VLAAPTVSWHESGLEVQGEPRPLRTVANSSMNASSRLTQRREPEAVVDELGVPDLETLLLTGEVRSCVIDSRSECAAIKASADGHS